jgi:hypothetical protein
MRMRELESKGIKVKNVLVALGDAAAQLIACLRCCGRSQWQARKSKIFMAGCLYMQCRKDDTGHVIRDFTSLVSTDVSSDGDCCLLLPLVLSLSALLLPPLLMLILAC